MGKVSKTAKKSGAGAKPQRQTTVVTKKSRPRRARKTRCPKCRLVVKRNGHHGGRPCVA